MIDCVGLKYFGYMTSRSVQNACSKSFLLHPKNLATHVQIHSHRLPVLLLLLPSLFLLPREVKDWIVLEVLEGLQRNALILKSSLLLLEGYSLGFRGLVDFSTFFIFFVCMLLLLVHV